MSCINTEPIAAWEMTTPDVATESPGREGVVQFERDPVMRAAELMWPVHRQLLSILGLN